MTQTIPQHGFTKTERRSVTALVAIYFLRMLGLFMVLPVLALYAEDLPGATPFMIGLALGIYGLTQAACQIPVGAASDRLGRKRVIFTGLCIFAVGSIVAALSGHILGIVFGRALQGVGAIAGATMALTADLTRDSQRTKAMAFIGISIGIAFATAFVIGPIIDSRFGLAGLFWCTTAMAASAAAILVFIVPTPPKAHFDPEFQPVIGDIRRLLVAPRLLGLNIGIFFLHCILAAAFVVIPVLLVDQAGLPAAEHARVYLPVLVLSLIFLAPMIMIADRKGHPALVYRTAIALIAGALAILSTGEGSRWLIFIALTLFFTGFNYLEASLPSLVSRWAPDRAKGTALGIYATCQFSGTFAGGLLGGIAAQISGSTAVFVLAGVFTIIWFIIASRMNFSAAAGPAA